MAHKTALMRMAEKAVGGPLEEWISERSAAGWSVVEMARHLGVTDACVWNWIQQLGGRKRVLFPHQDSPEEPVGAP